MIGYEQSLKLALRWFKTCHDRHVHFASVFKNLTRITWKVLFFRFAVERCTTNKYNNVLPCWNGPQDVTSVVDKSHKRWKNRKAASPYTQGSCQFQSAKNENSEKAKTMSGNIYEGAQQSSTFCDPCSLFLVFLHLFCWILAFLNVINHWNTASTHSIRWWGGPDYRQSYWWSLMCSFTSTFLKWLLISIHASTEISITALS